MRDVAFNNGGSQPYFCYTNSEGSQETIDYNPPIDKLWKDIHLGDFKVELLINPLLNKESNVYPIVKQVSSREETLGYVFPVSVLDSDETLEPEKLQNYVFVAFHELLSRLKEVKEGDFSDNFEKNVCVCVFHLQSTQDTNPLHLCIHDLRKFGYSYFVPNNNILVPDGYKADLYTKKKRIVTKLKEPSLYADPMVDMLLREYAFANNVTHRFVLLYQIVEYLIERLMRPEIQKEIDKLNRDEIPNNDFLERMRYIAGEGARIKTIFDNCGLTLAEKSCFINAIIRLYGLVGYNPSKTEIHELFYSFRNQMTHSYRKLQKEKAEMAITVQEFEILMMYIIEKFNYPL